MITLRFLSSVLCRLTSAVNDRAASAQPLVGACNVAFDPAQEWSTIRFGVYPNEAGLQVFDRPAAEAMVAAFNDKLNQLAHGFRGLPGFIGHPDEPAWLARNPTARREAVARVKDLRVTDDGLQFRVAYNDDGKRLLTGEAPAFDSFSPRWGMAPIQYKGRKAFRPLELYSVGYTNQPNIPGSYIGLNEALPTETAPASTTPMKELLIKILAALGVTLAADADEPTTAAALEQGLAKLTAAQGEMASEKQKATTAANEFATVKAQLAEAGTKLTAATNEATAAQAAFAAERKLRVDSVLDAAVAAGRITAAQRPEWAGKLTPASNEAFGTLAAELSALKPAVNTTSKTAGLGARRGAVDSNSKKRVTAINEAIDAKVKTSPGLSREAAYLALQKEQHPLFTATNA